MLEVRVGTDRNALVNHIGSVLSDAPLSDPMAAEWIVIPNIGIGRWLGLELSKRLGVSALGGDGIAANIELLTPAKFRNRVLDVDLEQDAWSLDRLTWVIHDEIRTAATDSDNDGIPLPPPDASTWAHARRLADLYARYMVHRPEMLAAWTNGDDVDGSGQMLAKRFQWQPTLWRRNIARIEAEPPTLDRMLSRDDPSRYLVADSLPERVTIFGLGSVPGGVSTLEVAKTVESTGRDVHLALLEPAMFQEREPASFDGDHRPNPLIAAWAKPAYDTLALFRERGYDLVELEGPSPTGASGPPTTLLERFQDALRDDRITSVAGEAGTAIDRADRSIRIHVCHGDHRQVDALGDEIRHLLDADPSLTEKDIVVLCPRLENFAPLIEARWGATARMGPRAEQRSANRESPLAYRIAGLSVADTAPRVAAMAALVELVGSRCTDTAVLDFLELPAVRARFDFSDEDLETIGRWAAAARVTWGMDGAHRTHWGIPEGFQIGTWSWALKRLLLGVALPDGELIMGPSDTVPVGVEGKDDLGLVGRVAEAVGRLITLVADVRTPRTATAWVDLLGNAATDLFAAGEETERQREAFDDLLGMLHDWAEAEAADSDSPAMTLRDIRAVVGSQLGTMSGGLDLFSGGVTVTSMKPLRGVPHEVVCVLGLDDEAFGTNTASGDDLVAFDRNVGDPDPQAEERAALLDAVLSAGSHLVVTRNGYDMHNNKDLDESVEMAELTGAIELLIDSAAVAAGKKIDPDRLRVHHPLHRHDARNFVCNETEAIDRSLDQPWSFDQAMLHAAQAVRSGRTPGIHAVGIGRSLSMRSEPVESEENDATGEEVVALDDLRDFLKAPVEYFLKIHRQIDLPDPLDGSGRLSAGAAINVGNIPLASEETNIPLGVNGLDRWKLVKGLHDEFAARYYSDGGDAAGFEDFVESDLIPYAELVQAHAQAAGTLPPGRYGDIEWDEDRDAAIGLTRALVDHAVSQAPECLDIDIPLDVDGRDVRLVGTVDYYDRSEKKKGGEDRPGMIWVTPSKADKAVDRIRLRLDVLTTRAAYPERPCYALHVRRPTKPNKQGYSVPGTLSDDEAEALTPERAGDALCQLVDLYLRGRNEPLPIFPETSAAFGKPVTEPLVDGKEPAPKGWASKWADSFSGFDESSDAWNIATFGQLSTIELAEMSCRASNGDDPQADDPPDPRGKKTNRVERYARVLWEALTGFAATRSEDDEP